MTYQEDGRKSVCERNLLQKKSGKNTQKENKYVVEAGHSKIRR